MPSTVRYTPPSGTSVRLRVTLRKVLHFGKRMAGLQTDDVTYAGALREVTKNEFELQHKGLIASASEEDEGGVAYDAGLVYPTEEEEKTLRRVPDAVPWNAYRAQSIFLTTLSS